MKQRILYTFLLIWFSISSYTQSNVDHNNMIGFGCGFSGEQSIPVQTVSKLIDKQEYNSIVQLLDSDNNAEKFLAVLVCEKLFTTGSLTINDKVKSKIEKIYNSNEIVSVCSGCTYWDTMTLKNILKRDNTMRISSAYWLSRMFEKQ